jgi:glycosyltransferase involved in cell wall biosynthesis
MFSYIALIEYTPNEGISKKVLSQSKYFSVIKNKCITIMFGKHESTYFLFENGLLIESKKIYYIKQKFINNRMDQLITYLKENINSFQFLYFRNFLPNLKLIKILFFLKNNHKKLYLEIPTWPYFYEQVYASRRKFLSIFKNLLEYLFIIFFHSLYEKVFYIKSNSKAFVFSNFYEITNAIMDKVPLNNKKLDSNIFNIVAVGTIYKYHGFDLLLKMLHQYNLKDNKQSVVITIIGNGPEIENLLILVKELNLTNNVKFTGLLSSNKLNDYYIRANFGLGALKLNLRNANIDTSIKNVEYLYNIIPFLSSGKIKNHEIFKDYYLILNKSTKISDLIEFSNRFYLNTDIYNLRQLIEQFYSWNSIYLGKF